MTSGLPRRTLPPLLRWKRMRAAMTATPEETGRAEAAVPEEKVRAKVVAPGVMRPTFHARHSRRLTAVGAGVRAANARFAVISKKRIRR